MFEGEDEIPIQISSVEKWKAGLPLTQDEKWILARMVAYLNGTLTDETGSEFYA